MNNKCFKNTTAEQAEFLATYLKEVLIANKSVNLTKITDYDEACILHLEDSLVALPQLAQAIEGPYADIGCGGGFPGVPLGFVSGRETWLVDSRSKKIEQVKKCIANTCKTLEIQNHSNFHFYAGRIEELAIEKAEYFSVCTARALADTTILLELAAPLLKTGGTLICLKSIPTDEEIDNATKIAPHLGFKIGDVTKFSLSNGATRQIHTYIKVGASEISLPRRCGKAQKSPLKPKDFK